MRMTDEGADGKREAKASKPKRSGTYRFAELGAFIARRRDAAGMSQKILAARLHKANPDFGENASPKRVSAWETGENRPNPDIAAYLLKLLEVAEGTPEYAEWQRLYRTNIVEMKIAAAEAERLRLHYLRWVAERFGRLDLYGLHGPDRRSDIELERVFVALRGGLANPYIARTQRSSLEQAEAWAELAPTLAELPTAERLRRAAQVARLGATELLAEVEDRGLPSLFGHHGAEAISLGEAFRREARLVILGDPGSGKTTLLRWLALMLAQAGLDQRVPSRVIVARHRVDPNADDINEEPFDLGPTRIPIFVRIAGYAQHRKRSGGVLPLIEHLGFHLAPTLEATARTSDGEALDPHALNAFFRSILRQRQAVLLFDGLDEIADLEDREPVAAEIEQFLDAHIPSSAGSPLATASLEGNQVVVTSRIVGYQMAGLGPLAAHMTLEPLGPRAAARYCRTYVTERLRAMHGPRSWDAAAQAAADGEAVRLLEEIEGLKARGIADLASTPLLLTILIMLAEPGGSLPERRVLLYRAAVEKILDTWRDRVRRVQGGRLPEPVQLRRFLCALAGHLQTHSGVGFIERDEARSCLEDLGTADEIGEFLACASEEIGLLTARGADVIGFQHQTFQEFFAAQWLLERPDELEIALHERSTLPRWREPILMAIGLLGLRRTGRDRARLERLLLHLAKLPQTDLATLPPEVVLACASLRELVWLPDAAVRALTDRIVDAREAAGPPGGTPVLDAQVRQALACLSESRARGSATAAICKALEGSGPAGTRRTLAAAALLQHEALLYDQDVVAVLARALPCDAADWHWPIDNALCRAVSKEPSLLPDSPETLRAILFAAPILTERFLADPASRRLALIVYGGTDANLLSRISDTQAELRRIREEQDRTQNRLDFPNRQQEVDRLEELRTQTDARLKQLRLQGSTISVGRMHRDAPAVTPHIVDALKRSSSIRSACVALRQISTNPEASLSDRVDATLAELAIGAVGAEEIAACVDTDIARAVLSTLSRFQDALRLAVDAVGRDVVHAAAAAAGSEPDRWLDLLEGLLAAHLQAGGSAFTLAELLKGAPPPVSGRIMAEIWQHHFSGAGDDPVYNLAVSLDTMGGVLGQPEALLSALEEAAAAQLGAAPGRAGWLRGEAVPIPRSKRQRVALALDAIDAIPTDFRFAAGWALSCLAGAISAAGFLEEAILIARIGIPKTFSGRKVALEALDRVSAQRGEFDEFAKARLGARMQRYAAGLAGSGPASRAAVAMPADDRTGGAGWMEVVRRLAALEGGVRQREVRSARMAPGGDSDVQAMERALALEATLTALTPLHLQTLIGCLDALSESHDFENRCRALLRMAARVPPNHEADFLGCALAQVRGIGPFRRKAITLRLFLQHSAGHDHLAAQAKLLAERLPDDDRQLALGYVARRVLSWEEALATGSDTAPIAAAALLQDAELALNAKLRSVDTRNAQHAAAGKASRLNASVTSILLNRAEARRLDGLHQSLDDHAFRKELGRVGSTTIEALPYLDVWKIARPLAADRCALLRAEVAGLEEGTITALVDLLGDMDDLTRCRAAMLLYGRGNALAQLRRVTRVGSTTVEAIARALAIHRSPAMQDPVRAQALSWALETFEHDDASAVGRWSDWLRQGASPQANFGGASIGNVILSSIHAVDEDVWRALLNQLQSGPPAVQRALLRSVCLMAAKDRLPDDAWADFAHAVARTDPAVLSAECFFGDLEGLARAICMGKAEPSPEPILRSVLDEAAILKRRCKLAGQTHFYNASYAQRSREAAAKLELTRSTYDALLRRLVERLAQWSMEGDQGFVYVTADLLYLAAAAAERSPGTFYQAVGIPTPEINTDTSGQLRLALEKALTAVVSSHSTFTGRAAAVVLLSYLRRITPGVCAALRLAVRDVPHVQAQALATAKRYRFASTTALNALFEGLAAADQPALGRYLDAQLLVALSQAAKGSTIEARVGSALRAAARDAVGIEVYAMLPRHTSTTGYEVRHIGMLDQLFLAAASESSGFGAAGAGAPAIEARL